MNELHEAARDYHRRHKLPITLCRAKKPFPTGWPAMRWTLREIDQQYRVCPTLNVGTRLGPGAGLIDFDADSPEAERAMLDLFDGDVPVTPTFTSPGGKHWLMAWSADLAAVQKAVVHFGPLEIRLGANGKAAQSLLPPSVTDGKRREYAAGLSLGECDSAIPAKAVVRRIIEAAGTHEISVSSVSSVSSVYPSPTPLLHTVEVQNAVTLTLPTTSGVRHRCIFSFARHLKAIPELAGANDDALRPIVEWWHEVALPVINTKPFEETWFDFRNAWQAVKYAAGTEPISTMYAKAISRLPPKCAAKYQQPQLRSLIALCRELQHEAGKDQPFYLAGRIAAEQIGIDHKTAARWLKMLCMDGVLHLHERGARHKASEYRYVGD